MPRHFSRVFSSPYFQTEHYKNETAAGRFEKMAEAKWAAFKNKLKFWK